MNPVNTPRYVHGCSACEFKGQAGRYDVYFCASCDGGTWIARYGSDGPDYASYPTFVLKTIPVDRFAESHTLSAINTFYAKGDR